MKTLDLNPIGLAALSSNEMIEKEGGIHPLIIAWGVVLAIDSFLLGVYFGDATS